MYQILSQLQPRVHRGIKEKLEDPYGRTQTGRAVQKSDPNNGIAVHVAKSHHSIDWKEARVVKSVQGYWD